MPLSIPAAPAAPAGSAREFAQDLAQVRLDNALLLFEEFVRASARHADAAALKGLERRFAECIQIQPSYWSQIKSRSRQIGERLARQFEEQCHKPRGWMDTPPGKAAAATAPADQALHDATPRDDDERFILGLVLTYYRRHPQRARTRLLDLLGEVLTTATPAANLATAQPLATRGLTPQMTTKLAAPPTPADDAHALWLKTQSGVAPLKRKPR
jgi:hypothetical protein